jgi:hypothetical protein
MSGRFISWGGVEVVGWNMRCQVSWNLVSEAEHAGQAPRLQRKLDEAASMEKEVLKKMKGFLGRSIATTFL